MALGSEAIDGGQRCTPRLAVILRLNSHDIVVYLFESRAVRHARHPAKGPLSLLLSRRLGRLGVDQSQRSTRSSQVAPRLVKACQTLADAGRLVRLRPVMGRKEPHSSLPAGAKDPTQFRVSGGAMCPAGPESGERAWSRDTAVARLVTAGIVQSWPTAGGDQEWALHWQYVFGR